jgi:nicotinamidase-related amidase
MERIRKPRPEETFIMKLEGFMTNQALVVIDVINGFITHGPLADPTIAQIIGPTVLAIEGALQRNEPVLAFRDAHEDQALEFEAYPPHCLKGTLESQLVNELLPYQPHMIDVEKNTTNGFFAEGFQTFMKNHPEITHYTCVGCCTDICVLQFALSLKTYAQTHDLLIRVSVIEEAVDTFDLPGHPKETFQAHALAILKAAGIHIR